MLTIEQVKAEGGYDVILCDFPWRYRNASGRGAAENHYTPDEDTGRSTMSIAEGCALPVGELAADDCALFMWGTWPQDREKYILGDAWGFDYKTLAFAWQKYYNNSCRLFYGQGRWTRANTEPVWLFTRGKPKRVDNGVDQLIETIECDCDRLLQAAQDGHSSKPEEVHHRIMRLCGEHSTKIELFARERVPGWDAWGNDAKLGTPDVILTGKERRHADEAKIEIVTSLPHTPIEPGRAVGNCPAFFGSRLRLSGQAA